MPEPDAWVKPIPANPVSDYPTVLPGGRVVRRLRYRWRDGTTHAAFEPLELVEKLPTLVPPPMSNLVRYHGVLAQTSQIKSALGFADPCAHLLGQLLAGIE